MIISKRFTFEASHILPKHEGKCSRLHGHSWGLTVSVSGNIDPATGFVMDYAKLKALVHEHIIDRLDHTHLGHGPAIVDYGATQRAVQFTPYLGNNFYPSSENLCRAIFKILNPLIEGSNDRRLDSIRIEETCTSAAVWRAQDEYTFEYSTTSF